MKRLAGALIIAGLVAGCGSYTKANFVAAADAICASTVRATRAVPPPSFGSSGAQQLSALATYLAVVSPIVQSEAKQIQALKNPSENARNDALRMRYLTALSQVADDYRKLAAAAKQGDAQAVANEEAALRASPIASSAQSYGLRSCGTAGATVS